MQGHSEKEKILQLARDEVSLKVTGENEVTRQRQRKTSSNTFIGSTCSIYQCSAGSHSSQQFNLELIIFIVCCSVPAAHYTPDAD